MFSNLTFLCCDQAIFIRGWSLMLIHMFLKVWWLFWCSKDEEHCQGRCAHCSPKNSGKSPVLALWGLLSVRWVLLMDKQGERLWKAGCENSSALLLAQRGVMCRAELLPLFSFPPLPPLFPCSASCMLWQIGAVSLLLPSRFSTPSSVLFSVVFPLLPVFLHVFVHSGWRLIVGWVCYKFFFVWLFF